jgi:hypothetical protein
MNYIWTCPHIGRTMTGNRPPLEEEGVIYAEVTDDVTPNSHYLATTGEVRLVPPPPVSDELWEFAPLQGRWVSLLGEAERAANLSRVRMAAVWHVNAACSAVRAQYVTPITGQELTYMMKMSDARAYLVDPAPDLANYPYIAGEVGLTAETPEQVAQVFLNLWERLRDVSARVETHRLSHIARIEAALDALQVQEERSAFDAAHAVLLGELTL